jgi:hypothetical protein
MNNGFNVNLSHLLKEIPAIAKMAGRSPLVGAHQYSNSFLLSFCLYKIICFKSILVMALS